MSASREVETLVARYLTAKARRDNTRFGNKTYDRAEAQINRIVEIAERKGILNEVVEAASARLTY